MRRDKQSSHSIQNHSFYATIRKNTREIDRMKPFLVQLSKTMAYALRHQPAQFGLTLDDEGWVAVDDLLAALRRHHRDWHALQAEDFAEVIAQSDKQRYEMRDGKIRAYYGHSTPHKITQA